MSRTSCALIGAMKTLLLKDRGLLKAIKKAITEIDQRAAAAAAKP